MGDNIEKVLSILNHQFQATALPPNAVKEVPQPLPAKDTEPADTFGNNPVLYIHYPPDADGPREQTAWKSTQHSLVYSLHQSADLDFPFSEDFDLEMSNPGFPFLPYEDRRYPFLRPPPDEIER